MRENFTTIRTQLASLLENQIKIATQQDNITESLNSIERLIEDALPVNKYADCMEIASCKQIQTDFWREMYEAGMKKDWYSNGELQFIRHVYKSASDGWLSSLSFRQACWALDLAASFGGWKNKQNAP